MRIDELEVGRWVRAHTNTLHLTHDNIAPTFLGRIEVVDRKAGRVRLRNEAGIMEVPAAWIVHHVTVVALVACSKSKLDEPAAAGDLYTGQLFQAARAWSERYADRWLILSARYGLVGPNIWIEPYNLTLNAMSQSQRRGWANRVLDQWRYRQVTDRLPDPHVGETMVVFLAGAAYREHLVGTLRRAGYVVVAPLQGLGYGQQVAWLQQHVRHSY